MIVGEAQYDTYFQSIFFKFRSGVTVVNFKPIRRYCGHLWWRIVQKITNKNKGRLTLASYQVSSNSVQGLQRKKSSIPQSNRGQGGNLWWRIGKKSTNLVKYIEYMVPIKFRQIPFRGCRGKVEHVSVNQRPGWPLLKTDWLEKHTLCKWRHRLNDSYQVLSNSVRRLRGEAKKCLSLIRDQGGHLCFPIGKKKNDRGRRVLAGCHISSNYVQQLQMESGKCISQLEATIAVFLLRSARKLQAWQWTLSTFFLQSFVKFHPVVTKEKSKCLKQSEAGLAIFVFRYTWRTRTW